MNVLQIMNSFYYDMVLNELRMMSKNMRYSDITYNSLLYLDLIAYKEKCTASSLAQALHISKSAVTVKVNELIQKGFIDKAQSQEDHRVYYLTLRPEVALEYKALDKLTLHAIQKMQTQYDEEQIDQFCSMMKLFGQYYREGMEHE